jgi:hypothetical protein
MSSKSWFPTARVARNVLILKTTAFMSNSLINVAANKNQSL